MKKISILIVFVFLIIVAPTKILASCNSTLPGDCSLCGGRDSSSCYYDNDTNGCICQKGTTNGNIGSFGTITNPIKSGSLGPNGGLISLLNNFLRLIIIGSGIYAFVQIILAGFGFISAGGDAKKIESSWNTIWQSVLGILIVASALTLAGLLGLILFGDPTAILNPKIYGPN